MIYTQKLKKMNNIEKKSIKLFLKDSIYNALAFFFTTGVQQLAILPYIAKIIPITEFGYCLSILGVCNILAATLGDDLGITKLISKEKYSINKCDGDFLIILLINSIVVVIITFIFASVFTKVSIINMCMAVLLSPLLTFRWYLISEYYIKQKFNKILLQSLFLAFGMLIGLFIFRYIKAWPIPFIVGELAAIIYSLNNKSFFKEQFAKTILFKDTIKKFLEISINTLVLYSISFADRLLINPLIGAESLSAYYTATFTAKMGSIVTNPVSSVILSRISKISSIKKREVKLTFYLLLISSILFMFLLYFCSIIISPFIIRTLYPKLYLISAKYVLNASIAISLYSGVSFIKPLIIKFCSTKNYLKINLIFGTFYITLCVILAIKFKLSGFIYGSIVSYFLYYITIVILGYNGTSRLEGDMNN